MPQSRDTNRRIVLNKRPEGRPDDETLVMQNTDVPVAGQGQMLLRTVYLSLDPYMRGRMSAAKSYAEPVAVGDVMVGGTISRVMSSDLAKFSEGDWVLSFNGWQDYAVSDGTGVTNLGPTPTHPSRALGIMGMPGFTAYCGLLFIGDPQPGETVVVAAATGPVGATVGQIAKLKGCRAVGVAGGAEKCRYAVEELGFDACLDRHAPDFPARLAMACPKGIDVYFENVGGAVLEAVWPLLNTAARMPVCGTISQYNATKLPDGPDRSALMMRDVLTKRIRMQGFIIFEDFADKYREFAQDMTAWIDSGQIKYREQIVDGLEAAPEAFNGLLEGRNFGKLVVQVAQD